MKRARSEEWDVARVQREVVERAGQGERVFLVIVEGLGMDILQEKRMFFEKLWAAMGVQEPYALPVEGSVYAKSTVVKQVIKMAQDSSAKKAKVDGDGIEAEPTQEEFLTGVKDDLLTKRQLEAHGYPLDVNEQKCIVVDTASAPVLETHLPVVAIDCEMSYTHRGLELTRMTLVDYGSAVLCDVFVKPDVPITDLNTRYSGITQEMMDGPTLSPAEARGLFCKYVGANTILVGHSAENDLRAVGVVHVRVLDTAVLYSRTGGVYDKRSLKYLAYTKLGEEIQSGPHCSEEDAVAALRLAKLSLQSGGVSKVHRKRPPSLFDVLCRRGHVSAAYDRKSMLKLYQSDSFASFPCPTDAIAIQKAKQSTYAFSLVRLLGIRAAVECKQHTLTEPWRKLREHLEELRSCGTLIVMGGNVKSHAYEALRQEQKDLKKKGASVPDDLTERIHKAFTTYRRGFVWLGASE